MAVHVDKPRTYDMPLGVDGLLALYFVFCNDGDLVALDALLAHWAHSEVRITRY